MNLGKHISLAKPRAKVSWSIAEKDLITLLAPTGAKQVVPGQLKSDCALADGLSGECRFHFDASGRLRKVQLERLVRRHRQKAFDGWNSQLIAWLEVGTSPVKRSSTWYEWALGKLNVVHIQHWDGRERVEISRS